MAKSNKTAAKAPRPARVSPAPQPDARNMVRIYADIDSDIAVELSVLATRKRVTRKALLELLILEAVKQKTGN